VAAFANAEEMVVPEVAPLPEDKAVVAAAADDDEAPPVLPAGAPPPAPAAAGLPLSPPGVDSAANGVLEEDAPVPEAPLS